MKLRHEYKHPVNQFDLLQLQRRLPRVMKRDENCDESGGYTVHSLYFDNVWDKAFREKVDGVNYREKFRIRYYNHDTSFMRLEKKSKVNGLCRKESVPISKELCEELLQGNPKGLLKSQKPLLQELYAKWNYQCLRPKSIVVYRRESFVFGPGNVRVTLDSKICGSNQVWKFLNPDHLLMPKNELAVLEVKWDEFLPAAVKNAVCLPSRRATAFSKYTTTRFGL
ncbi:MAG: polyphosphate polymerase domain-containing protein [Clostridia bacterium]|nr:polyphosphate polymerase domain-containing protein [Clostridia bacterium]